ncbi:GntR family transcriptional regulator [Asticcacaulis sp.]|uniref:GntR family transcriptional regulator n=1 Tax=Asticcacaulis sp. TaxID=1872648 RepID=UPI003F7CABF8
MPDNPSLIEDIYTGLKDDLLSGSRLPGERIDIADILRRFPASKTPILLALNRLVGEGIIESRPHDGYYIPRMTTDSLRELYQCDIQILTLILDNVIASPTPPLALSEVALSEHDSVADTETLFLAIASLSGNREFVKIVDGLNFRLRPLRRLKASTGFNVPAELLPFKDAWRAGDFPQLKSLVSAYHDRRIAHIPEFIALAYTAPITRFAPKQG